jgi:uncharacterized protein (UPF0335 family)
MDLDNKADPNGISVHTGPLATLSGRQEFRELAQEIEQIEIQIAELNATKQKVYAKTKKAGFDVPALKAAISVRRKRFKDPHGFDQRSALTDLYMQVALTDLYMQVLEESDPVGPRAHVQVHAHEGTDCSQENTEAATGTPGAGIGTPAVKVAACAEISPPEGPEDDGLEIPDFLRLEH